MTDWDDYTAIKFLKDKGHHLTRQWTFIHPSNFAWADLSEEEQDAIWYLVEEWDFGGYETV